jgi:hypothetical protein
MWQSHGERFRNAKFNPTSPGESFAPRTRRPPLRPPGAESLNWLVACMLSRMLNCRLSSLPLEVSLTTSTILVFFSRNSQNKIPSIAKAKLQSRSAIHPLWGWKVDVFGQMSSPIDIKHEDRCFLLLSPHGPQKLCMDERLSKDKSKQHGSA